MPGKAPQHHGLPYPQGAIVAAYQQKSQQGSQRAVSAQVAAGAKTAQPRRHQQRVPLLRQHMNIAGREQEQKDQLGRTAQTFQGVPGRGRVHAGCQRQKGADNGVGFDRHQQGQTHARSRNAEKTPLRQNRAGHGQGRYTP